MVHEVGTYRLSCSLPSSACHPHQISVPKAKARARHQQWKLPRGPRFIRPTRSRPTPFIILQAMDQKQEQGLMPSSSLGQPLIKSDKVKGLISFTTWVNCVLSPTMFRSSQPQFNCANSNFTLHLSEYLVKGQVKEEEIVDNKILPYCSINKKETKRTVGELEQDFLEALQSFYFENKPIMTNEEFDNLKEELMWEGSSVVMLSKDEQTFMEASLAYNAGKPIMTDVQYDELKLNLKKAGSKSCNRGSQVQSPQ